MQISLRICLFFIFVFPLFCFGQSQSRKEVKGKLLASKENLYLETVYVYNKQSGSGILSDALGNFKLEMREGDTIAVSALHIAPSEVVVERMHLNDAFITLAVDANLEYLSEVRISNRSLTGDLSRDMKNIPITPIISSTDLGFPGPKYTMTPGERELNAIAGGPIELLAAAITGDLRKIKRSIATEKRNSQLTNVYQRMPTSFYTANLNIKKENIPHFIDFCESEKSLEQLAQVPIEEFVDMLLLYAVRYKEAFPERF